MNGAFRFGLAAVLCGALFACSSAPAPVEDRSARVSSDYSPTRNGYYRVRKGDTLYSIAFNFRLDWKDVARWNNVRRPYTIYPGQELRLTAPPGRRTGDATITTRPAGAAPKATTRTAEADTPPPAAGTADTGAAPAEPWSNGRKTPPATGSSRIGSPPAAQDAARSPPGPLKDPERWLWPTKGRVISNFSPRDPSRKGIDISGREGQAIVASAAGDVVYSGNGLIGFGELIIIKHSDSMLTAYAHNRRRLVKEGDRVAAGSQIAEMGRNDQEKTMLHFELRVDGKPVDPLRYLPPR